MGQIRSWLQASGQHDQRQVTITLRIRESLIGHNEWGAGSGDVGGIGGISAIRCGVDRKGGDDPVAHVARLDAEQAPLAKFG